MAHHTEIITLLVRQLRVGKTKARDSYEVVDGNHRLEAVKILKWKTVPCENLGKISLSEAVLVARRRNENWFDVVLADYAALFTNEVLKDNSLDDLAAFMPDTVEAMQDLQKLLDFDWSQFDDHTSDTSPIEAYLLHIQLHDDLKEAWIKWKSECENKPDEDCLALLLEKVGAE